MRLLMGSAMKCPICKNRKFKTEFEVTRRDNKYAYTGKRQIELPKYFVCDNCEVMILDDIADYEKIYTDGTYYAVDSEPMDFLHKRFQQVISFPKGQSDNLERIERIKSFLKTQEYFKDSAVKKVLDIGAGMGVFLYQFLDDSWKGTALEPDPNAFKHMKKVLPNVEIINGLTIDIPPDNKYDLITMNRVLEHIYDPFDVLSAIKKHITDEGILYLELPDAISYYKDGPNNPDFGWGHYCVYSPNSLLLLTSQAGFEFVSMSRQTEPSGKFTLYGFFRKSNIQI